MTPTTALIYIAQTLISTAIIYTAWGTDAPICNFALVFGGLLLGHTMTEALNVTEDGE